MKTLASNFRRGTGKSERIFSNVQVDATTHNILGPTMLLCPFACSKKVWLVLNYAQQLPKTRQKMQPDTTGCENGRTM